MLRNLKILLILSPLLIASTCDKPSDVTVLVGDSESRSLMKKENDVIVKQVFCDSPEFDNYFAVNDVDMQKILNKLSQCNE